MLIDELIEIKKSEIEKNKNRFPDIDKDDVSLEMFTKKYEGTFYKYYSPFSKKPFINQLYFSQIKLWDDRHYDANDLPRLKDKIYNEITNFPDYDYLNSIAYEMLIRTPDYISLRDYCDDYKADERQKKFDQLGIDINDVFDLKKVSNHFCSNETNKNFNNSYFTMTLNDLDNALGRLVQFYMDKKLIHVIDNVDKIVLGHNQEIIIGRTFKAVSDVCFEEVNKNLSNYFIPAKFDFNMPTQQDKFSMIDKNIPLVALEQEFLLSIDDLIPNRIKGSIEFNSTRPLLRFKEMPIIDVPLNLNLSTDELIELVTKLKSDFENGIVKNPANILYSTKYKFKNLKDITPFKMTRESVAEAFFIYDLYQYIEAAMILHKEKLRQLKNFDIKEIKNQTKISIKEKQKEISKIIEDHKKKTNGKPDKFIITQNKYHFKSEKRRFEREQEKKIIDINKRYKEYLKDYHTMTVLEKIGQLHNITPYMCKQYLKFMRQYIENLKYKELIVGIKMDNC